MPFLSAVQPWELDLVAKVAQAFRTPDRRELEAYLAMRFLQLKRQPLGHVRDWQAYLAKCLYNKASNWGRDFRRREERLQSLRLSFEHDTASHSEGHTIDALESRVAFETIWASLNPELRRFWSVLAEENGNQLATARRLGIHRNTVRSRLRHLKEALESSGMA